MEKTLKTGLSGFRIIIVMPKLIKGLLKATTRCLAVVIVSGATATSASYK